MSDAAHHPLVAKPGPACPLPPQLAQPGKTCRLRLQFSIFFDGTNNNKDEDKPSLSHSNIARLYDAARDEPSQGVFAVYVPGVGTPFEDIGEPVPHEDGSSMGTMGAERIRYALLAVANRISRVLGTKDIIPEDKDHMPSAVRDDGSFARCCLLLTIARKRKPVVEEIVIDVFGFSRGATAARSFVNQLLRHFCDAEGHYCGMKLRLRFMGLFDTVASVGLADSFPVPGVEGHQDWGDEDLLVIPPQVERGVHFVAAHEGRNSFPVDLVLRKDKTYPANFEEVVYPGVHSDVGGGYGPGDQGKGYNEASGKDQGAMLSQIALNDMYERAMRAGVALIPRKGFEEARLTADFSITPALRDSFNHYMGSVRPLVDGKRVTEHMKVHRRYYLAWRRSVLSRTEFAQQLCISRSRTGDPQGHVNLIAANDELREQLAEWDRNARELATYNQRVRDARGAQEIHGPAAQDGVQYLGDWQHAPRLSPDLYRFFENYVHDSRAGFLMTDPVKQRDHDAIKARLDHQDKNPIYDPKSGMHLNPLTPREREVLAIYRQNKHPIYTDEQPGAISDGAINAIDVVAAVSRRREMRWSYLHPRQVFAYSRLKY